MKKSGDQQQGPVGRPSTAAARAEEVAATLASFRSQRLERQRQMAALLTQVRTERQAARRALRAGSGPGGEPARPGGPQPLLDEDPPASDVVDGDEAADGDGLGIATAAAVSAIDAEAEAAPAPADNAADGTDKGPGDLDGDPDACAEDATTGDAGDIGPESSVAVEPDPQDGLPVAAEATLPQPPLAEETAQPDPVERAADDGLPVVDDPDGPDAAAERDTDNAEDAAAPEAASCAGGPTAAELPAAELKVAELTATELLAADTSTAPGDAGVPAGTGNVFRSLMADESLALPYGQRRQPPPAGGVPRPAAIAAETDDAAAPGPDPAADGAADFVADGAADPGTPDMESPVEAEAAKAAPDPAGGMVGTGTPETSVQPAAAVATATVPDTTAEVAAEVRTAPDLTALPAIGPAMRVRLRQIGIGTVADLARADTADLRERLGDVSRLVPVADWVAAAQRMQAAGHRPRAGAMEGKT